MSTGAQMFNFDPTNNQPGTFGGSNQYGSYPMVSMGTSGMSGNGIPGMPVNQTSPTALATNTHIGSGGTYGPGGAYQGTGPTTTGTGTGQYQVGTPQDPLLTSQFLEWLRGQIGEGAPAFDWSSIMPSSGQVTGSGQLSAPINPMLQQLISLMGSPNNPMNQMDKTGDPTDVGPAWQAMIAAQNQNIKEKQAQMKEQFSAGGNLDGSPFGTAMSDFQTQTALGQNAILTQAQQQAQEAAKGRMLTADELQQNFSKYVQSLDQASIDRMYKEFVRTSPDYNPLIANEQAGAAQYPPYLHTKDTMDQVSEGIHDATSVLSALFGGSNQSAYQQMGGGQ